MSVDSNMAKNGSQQAVNAPMMTPSVLVALHSLTVSDGVDDRDLPVGATMVSAPAPPLPVAVDLPSALSAWRRRNAPSSLRHRRTPRPFPPFTSCSSVFPSTPPSLFLSPTILKAMPSSSSAVTGAFCSSAAPTIGTARKRFLDEARSKVKVTGPINVHAVNTQHLSNGKAYEL